MDVQRESDIRWWRFDQVGVLGAGRGDALVPGVGLVARLGGSEMPHPCHASDRNVAVGVRR